MLNFARKNLRSPQRAQLRKRLRKYTYVQDESGETDIMRKRVLSEIPLLNRFLLNTPGLQSLDRLITQANAKYPMGFYLLFVLLLAAVGFIVVTLLMHNQVLALLSALINGSLPLLYLKLLKQKRIEKFQSQLPDALDLIARALKAGHAFTGGMKLASEEFDDPLGPEFSETLDEINFGVSVSNALTNMTKRIDCPELNTKKGQQATQFVEEQLRDCEFIIVKTYKDDKYARPLADIFFNQKEDSEQQATSNGIFLNQLLLDKGLAVRIS